MAGHCFEYIGNSENARFQENFIPFDAIGIATPIHPFMMLPDDVCNRIWELNAFSKFIARDGVLLYNSKFRL